MRVFCSDAWFSFNLSSDILICLLSPFLDSYSCIHWSSFSLDIIAFCIANILYTKNKRVRYNSGNCLFIPLIVLIFLFSSINLRISFAISFLLYMSERELILIKSYLSSYCLELLYASSISLWNSIRRFFSSNSSKHSKTFERRKITFLRFSEVDIYFLSMYMSQKKLG